MSSFSSRLLSLSPSVSVLSLSVDLSSFSSRLLSLSLTFSRVFHCYPHLYVIILFPSSLTFSHFLTFSECVSVIPICMSSFSSRLLSLSLTFSHFLRVFPCYPHLYVIILFPSSLTFSQFLSLSPSVSVLSPSVGHHYFLVFIFFCN